MGLISASPSFSFLNFFDNKFGVMKTINNFSELPKNEQIYQINHFGCLLGKRNTSEFEISLYLIENQYVEIWYDCEMNRIDNILPVESENIVDLYPLELDIQKILNG